MLDSLSYCSRGNLDLDGEALRKIISVSRRNNAIHGITGLLVHDAGLYFQWLEGPQKALQNLMAKICKDPRHDSLVILGANFDEPERVSPSGTWSLSAPKKSMRYWSTRLVVSKPEPMGRCLSCC